MKRLFPVVLACVLALCLSFSACTFQFTTTQPPTVTLDSLPAYAESPYVAINGNIPQFDPDDYTTASFETYSRLDALGRCGVAYACIGADLMPTEPRGNIGQVKPSGWQTAKYDFVDGRYLYNRCHLIGYQLSGENANERNLITGTRYLNVQGMLPFENLVADYVKETGHHVLYRVTPVFEGTELVARGVVMEGYSVEDEGEGVCFAVFCYNVQPGVNIDYATGKSALAESDEENHAYILNTNSKKFHNPSCPLTKDIKNANKQTYNGSRENLIRQGYAPCKSCQP